ncbi:MAG: NADP-dependent oxidoreductase [Porphyromonas sp.]|nr:NADP-dependent oxidoreductase [Porphyromonas sp.]
MKAYQISGYNKQELRMQAVELARPAVQANEILIEVKAAGVNPLDNMIIRGDVKLVTPYDLPLTMGQECAGVVVELGREVKGFALGDKVFTRVPTHQGGAFAEYIAIAASEVALMPEGLSFVEAASIPLTALTAYQALELMQPKAGESIFISGGSGGLGAMAIPLAKARGLEVYTNGNAESRERVLALGADKYLDYRREDYLEHAPKVNYVLDSLGGTELSRQMQLLKPGGAIVSLRGLPNGSFARRFGLPLWKQWLFGLVGWSLDRQAKAHQTRYEFLFVQSNGRQLAEVAQMIEQRGIRPSVDQVFPFSEANEALAKVARGGSQGKVVLSME